MKTGDEEYTTVYQSLMALESAARRVPEHLNIARRYLAAGDCRSAGETAREAATALIQMAEATQREGAALLRWAEEQSKGANRGE